MKKRIYRVSVVLLAVFMSGCGKDAEAYFEAADVSSEAVSSSEEALIKKTAETEEEEAAGEEICVYVCGAVPRPGVYRLAAKSRIYEAVRLAGGLCENACEDAVNQAQLAADGQMIRIPTKEEAAGQAREASSERMADDGKIDLNAAGADALMTLPGIGASKAAGILSYREEHGGFASVEEIKNIPGIKDGVFSKIKDYITVR